MNQCPDLPELPGDRLPAPAGVLALVRGGDAAAIRARLPWSVAAVSVLEIPHAPSGPDIHPSRLRREFNRELSALPAPVLVLIADDICPDVCLHVFELGWTSRQVLLAAGPNSGSLLLAALTLLAAAQQQTDGPGPISRTMGLLDAPSLLGAIAGACVAVPRADLVLAGPEALLAPLGILRRTRHIPAAPISAPPRLDPQLLAREAEAVRTIRASGDPARTVETGVHEIHSRQYLRLFRMLMDPADLAAAHTLTCFQSGQLEPLEFALFAETVCRNPGCLILDAGANYGLYTLLSCRLAALGLTDRSSPWNPIPKWPPC